MSHFSLNRNKSKIHQILIGVVWNRFDKEFSIINSVDKICEKNYIFLSGLN